MKKLLFGAGIVSNEDIKVSKKLGCRGIIVTERLKQ